tara:strand:- start:53 stop:730 length:678 start_codon:yes stop_codon:yes gene_type:complete
MTEIAKAKAHIAKIGQMLFQRRLTDAAGGNVSVRVDDVMCMSPSYSGSKRQWELESDQVLVVGMDGKILEGDGEVSRETNVHVTLNAEFSDYGNAVIHAHPRNLLVFAALEESMPPVLEANLKFGEIPCVPYAPAHSPDLARHVANGIRGHEERIRKHAFGVIAPWHGLFLMGKDLDAAFDAVERFDTNARAILMARMTGRSDKIEEKREALQQIVKVHEQEHKV